MVIHHDSLALITLTSLCYSDPHPNLSARWKVLAASPLAWYQVVFVFPTNDRLVEIKEGQEIEQDSDKAGADEQVRGPPGGRPIVREMESGDIFLGSSFSCGDAVAVYCVAI